MSESVGRRRVKLSRKLFYEMLRIDEGVDLRFIELDADGNVVLTFSGPYWHPLAEAEIAPLADEEDQRNIFLPVPAKITEFTPRPNVCGGLQIERCWISEHPDSDELHLQYDNGEGHITELIIKGKARREFARCTESASKQTARHLITTMVETLVSMAKDKQ